MITSTSNQQIKDAVRLQKKAKERKDRGLFLVEGFKMVKEASALGLVEKVYISEALDRKEESEQLRSVLEQEPYEWVSKEVFKTLSDTMTPQGILAVVKMPVYTLEELFTKQNLLFLEDVRDPGNVGTMVRTAEGASFGGVVLSKESADLFNPKVVRSTMGSIFRMPYIYVDSIPDAVLQAKEKGFHVYGTHLRGEHSYSKESYLGKTGIVIGNESRGMSGETAKAVSTLVKIPMGGSVESLNAAVAAAVMMYEVARQQGLSSD
ncbi:MAG: RNA methyltransferase [Clostridiales bacterium]|nr:RNA methyltransferase [Clostridiales bacterium]